MAAEVHAGASAARTAARPPRCARITRLACSARTTGIVASGARGHARSPCSDAQEAAQRDARAERRDRRAGGQQQHHEQREARSSAARRSARSGPTTGRRRSPSRPRAARPPTAPPRKPDHQALDHERPADEPVGRAHEPHHLDLAPAGEDRQPDRVRHEQDEASTSSAASAASRILIVLVAERIFLVSSSRSLISSIAGLM